MAMPARLFRAVPDSTTTRPSPSQPHAHHVLCHDVRSKSFASSANNSTKTALQPHRGARRCAWRTRALSSSSCGTWGSARTNWRSCRRASHARSRFVPVRCRKALAPVDVSPGAQSTHTYAHAPIFVIARFRSVVFPTALPHNAGHAQRHSGQYVADCDSVSPRAPPGNLMVSGTHAHVHVCCGRCV